MFTPKLRKTKKCRLCWWIARRTAWRCGFSFSPNSSTATDTDAAGLDQLQRGGVKVRYLTSPYVHAKVFVVDGALAYVGSHNFSRSSLELNRELGIIFSDQTAIVRLWTTYEADWAKGKDR